MEQNSDLNVKPKSETVNPLRTVYLLWHTDSYGDEKLIGVYATKSDASSAIERVMNKPGFSEGGAFGIAEYKFNEDHWIDGFRRQDGFSVPYRFRTESGMK